MTMTDENASEGGTLIGRDTARTPRLRPRSRTSCVRLLSGIASIMGVCVEENVCRHLEWR